MQSSPSSFCSKSSLVLFQKAVYFEEVKSVHSLWCNKSWLIECDSVQYTLSAIFRWWNCQKWIFCWEMKFVRVSNFIIRQVCVKFTTNPVVFAVLHSLKVFKLFLSAFEGETIEVTKVNFQSFSELFVKNLDDFQTKWQELKEFLQLSLKFQTKLAELRVTFQTLWRFPGIPRLNSQIISDFPGNRDGFDI
jgi:hypothetical protein